MSSFGNDIVCKNIQCNTVNGNAPTGGSSKWTDVGDNNIERTNGNVIVKNQLEAENVKINDTLTVENDISIQSGGIDAASGNFTGANCINLRVDNVSAKSGTIVTVNNNLRVNGEINNTAPNDTTNIDLFGNKKSGDCFINLNTAGIDIPNAETIYFINFQKKPDGSASEFFRINMSGDIIGCKDIMDCNDIGCNDIECSSVQIENKIDYSKCKKGLIESGQGMRILKFDTSFINYFNFTLSPADPNVSDGDAVFTKFKIQHSDANVNNVIGTEYIVRLSSFNVTGTDFNIFATVNVLAPNDLELYMTSIEKLTNGLQLRFLMELIPIDFS